MNTTELLSLLVIGENEVDPEFTKILTLRFGVIPDRDCMVEVPLSRGITLKIKLILSKDYDFIKVKDKFYYVFINSQCGIYRDASTAVEALETFREDYYSKILGE
jgi:hypothetical protein